MIGLRQPQAQTADAERDASTRGQPSKCLRILIIGINYAPELTGIGPYTTAVAEHYARHGHSVRVITGAPHYPEWRRRRAPAQGPGANPRVTRYWHFVPRRATALSRMLYEATWLISASRGALTIHSDVVIGVMPNLAGGLLALVARRRSGAHVGLVIQDLVGPAAAQSGYRAGGMVAGLTTRAERLILRQADRVAVICSGFAQYVQKAGVPSERVNEIRNWMHDTTPSESVAQCRTRLGWASGDFVCLHAGNMGQKQGLDTVLDAASLVATQDIKVVLSGDGNDRARLEALAQGRRLTNLSFVDLQPPGRYEAMLRAADVLLLNQRRSVGDMSLPSKLASYFASGRPVVAAVAVSSEAAHLTEESGSGMAVPPDDPAALADALILLRDFPGLAKEMGARGKAYADRNLSPQSALAGYDAFLQSLRTGRISALDAAPETASGVRG